MSENLGNHCGIFDGGDVRHRATTLETDGHVDREDALEQLGPAQAGSRGSTATSIRLRLTKYSVKNSYSPKRSVRDQAVRSHLGLPNKAPPRAPAQASPLV